MPFHQKIPCLFLLLACCLAAGLAHGQSTFTNPSFEGTPAPHTVPPGWTNCYGTPDLLPGPWDVTLAPANGSSYLGLVAEGGEYKEAAGQAFTFAAGTPYSISLDLAGSLTSYDYNYTQIGRVNVWVGTTSCNKSQLIWTSPVLTTTWQNFTINFTPTTAYSFITLECNYPGASAQGCGVLIDNLRLNSCPTTTPTAAAAGTLATQNRVWDLAQPLNLLTNSTVTGGPAANVKWTAEYQRDGQTQFTRVISNPSAFRFETPGVVVLRPAYFCDGNKVNFAAPIQVTVTDGFNQKIEVKWPGAHVDIFVVCEVSVKRGTLTYFKGTTSSAGRLYVEGLRNGDQLQVKSTSIMRPYASATYNVTFSAEQATPILINLAPAYVDPGL